MSEMETIWSTKNGQRLATRDDGEITVYGNPVIELAEMVFCLMDRIAKLEKAIRKHQSELDPQPDRVKSSAVDSILKCSDIEDRSHTIFIDDGWDD